MDLFKSSTQKSSVILENWCMGTVGEQNSSTIFDQ